MFSVENIINQFGEFGAIHGQGQAAKIVDSLVKTIKKDKADSGYTPTK